MPSREHECSFWFFFCKENANERNESLLSNCRVQVFLLQRYNKKQLFAIVCSDFVLKSAHIFNFYTEYQEVTKHKKMTRLAHTVSKTGWGKTLSFLSKSFLSFSKSKTHFVLYKEYIYKYIFIYIFFIELFFYFQNRKWQKWLWQKWQDSDKLIPSKTILHFLQYCNLQNIEYKHNKESILNLRFYA